MGRDVGCPVGCREGCPDGLFTGKAEGCPVGKSVVDCIAVVGSRVKDASGDGVLATGAGLGCGLVPFATSGAGEGAPSTSAITSTLSKQSQAPIMILRCCTCRRRVAILRGGLSYARRLMRLDRTTRG